MSQVISLTEKLQDKETSPSSATITTAAQEVDQPDEHTEAASTTGFATVDGALAAPPPGHQQPPHKDDLVSSGGTNDDGDGGAAVVVFDVTEGANDRLSCESAYFADAAEAYERDCAGHYALSSEEEDGGAVSDEGCSFDLPRRRRRRRHVRRRRSCAPRRRGRRGGAARQLDRLVLELIDGSMEHWSHAINE